MALYKNKPVILEAFKWTGEPDQTEDPVWLVTAIASGKASFANLGTSRVSLVIFAAEGAIQALPGDFIARDSEERIHIFPPAIFEKQFEELTKPSKDYIAELENRLFELGAMNSSPCFKCGFKGAGYFQPN
ncbi:MAG: hypothetical protein PHX79_03675, partial [Sphaerochaetaceae bacterium]|nr:hypothetical protein [Sphaerochaetaceae bacterium]